MAAALPDDALVDLVFAWDEHEAALIAGELRASGIDAVVLGAGIGNWSEIPGVQRPRVQVRYIDQPRALDRLIDLSERIGEARRQRGQDDDAPCPACGYDLRGTAHDICPECGINLGGPMMRFVVAPPPETTSSGMTALVYAAAALLVLVVGIVVAVATLF